MKIKTSTGDFKYLKSDRRHILKVEQKSRRNISVHKLRIHYLESTLISRKLKKKIINEAFFFCERCSLFMLSLFPLLFCKLYMEKDRKTEKTKTTCTNNNSNKWTKCDDNNNKNVFLSFQTLKSNMFHIKSGLTVCVALTSFSTLRPPKASGSIPSILPPSMPK